MPNRRSFLTSVSAAPLLGAALTASDAKAAAAPQRDYFKELGVRPFINAAGTYTMFTASLMPREVMQAMDSASRSYVRLDDLHDAVGKKIAEMIGVEAAMVSAGAASALTLGTAACMTGKDADKIRRLPDTTGMKNEVIIQKAHRYDYEHAIRNCGIRFVEVETAEELESAVTANTAMMMYFNAADPPGKISDRDFAALGRKHSIPTFNDAAADVPPVEHLSSYTKMGFDLVTFSGGKGIRGPQSAGLLLGRKDLIEAARLNTSPHSDSIGRGMKVNKEEMVGMMVALDLYLKRDHAAEWREWERRVKLIADSVAAIPTVRSETWIPEIANHVPHLKLSWDEAKIKLTPAEAAQRLRDGEPSIEVVPGRRPELVIGVWMMQPGDAEVVASRLRQVLRAAAA